MNEWLSWYLAIATFWAGFCLFRTWAMPKYTFTWKTFVLGIPGNFIFWPLSMIWAIRLEYRIYKRSK